MRRSLLFIFSVLSSAAFSQASDSSVYSIDLRLFRSDAKQIVMVCNKSSVKTNEEFEVRVISNFAVKFMDKPSFGNVEVVAGPMANCKSVYKNSKYIIYQLFGYKLRAGKSGKVHISPVMAYTDSAQYTSNALDILVDTAHVPLKKENQNLYSTMLLQAGVYTKSLVSKDYQTVINYSLPGIVEKSGGRDSAIAKMKRDIEKVEKNGTSLQSITLGKPMTIYKDGTELHCMLPMVSVLQFPSYKWFINSSFLAISKDNGKNWYFVDVTSVKWSPKTVAELLPSRNPGLLLPKPVYLQQ